MLKSGASIIADTTKPNPLDKAGVSSLYLCRRGTQDDEELLQLNAAGGCKPQTHIGWMLVSATLIGASLYIAMGLVYSVKVKEMPLDVEAVPNIQFWRQLFGLVKDGITCTMAKISGKAAGASDAVKEEPLLVE